MNEGPLEEGEALLRVKAGEEVKAAFPTSWVGVALSDENRSFEPWVILGPQSSYALGYRQFAFAPLHQRPTSPMGQMGVEVGHIVVGRMCPGMFMGFFHPEGDQAVERWALANDEHVLPFLGREIAKVNREIEDRDVKSADGSSLKPSEEQIDTILGHLSHFEGSLKEWVKKIENRDLSSVPRMDG